MAKARSSRRVWAKRAVLWLLTGTILNILVAIVLALWLPPWHRKEELPRLDLIPLVGSRSAVRTPMPVPESFPQLLRRGGWRWRSGFGWRIDEWYGDSAMGRQQLTAQRRIVSSGWPFPTLRGEHTLVSLPGQNNIQHSSSIAVGPQPASTDTLFAEFKRVPLVPIPLGFACNSMAWSMLVPMIWIVARSLRRWRRRRAGRCVECGYDLRHDLLSGCPECGWRRATHVSKE